MKPFSVFIRVVVGLLIALVCLEILARVGGWPGARFRLDSELGWVRRAGGHESPASQDDARKMLVLGDSFIFGEEVTREQRFDHVMQGQGYRDEIINLGVSGYSTDQEMIAALDELNTLKAGDTVVLTTFGDDLRGILSDFFAGRAKPKFHIESEQLILSRPKIDSTSQILDRFYLTRVAHKIFRSKPAAEKVLDRKEFEEALKLYDALIFQYLVPVKDKNVDVLIAFHGKKMIDEDFGIGAGDESERFLRNLCDKYKFLYLSMDGELDSPNFRQAKGVHWNAKGHQKFAELLIRTCDKSNNQLHLSQKESR